MTPKGKLVACLLANTVILGAVVTLVTVFATDSAYWSWGWSDDLVVISVKIDTVGKYLGMLAVIATINISKVIVEEIGMPVLGFSIYNPDKKVIDDFTKNELQFFANAMFMVSGLRGVFMMVVSITQIDIALWSLLVSEFTSFYTIRLLLNEKQFPRDDPHYVPLRGVAVN